MAFAYIWEYRVKMEHIESFRLTYHDNGEWVRFFRRDPAYIRTHLFSDLNDRKRFITIDYRDTQQACYAFRKRFRAEFDAIDNRCVNYITEERHLGDFDLPG